MFHTILKSISACIILLLFSSSAFSDTQNQDNRVDKFVQALMLAYENHDLNKMKNSYAPDAVVIGTGQDEIFHGRKQITDAFKKEFSQQANVTLEAKPMSVFVEKNLAVASYLVRTNVQLPNRKPVKSVLRLSLVLVKDHQGWRILQSHLSAPLADQQLGESFPVKS
jgi:uncharacterized protein (TIGR02246 family)